MTTKYGYGKGSSGQYNEAGIVLEDGQQAELQLDSNGRLITNATVTATFVGPQEVIISNTDDSIAIGTSSTLFTGTTQGSKFRLDVDTTSEGVTGSMAPTSAIEIGAVDSGGKLQALTVDPAGKLLVDISGSSTVTGTVNANIEGLNAFQTSQYMIGSSSVQLTPTPLTSRSSMSIKAVLTGSNILYIGNSSAVTASTGYPLFNGDSLQIDLTPSQSIYAISTAAGQIAAVMEIG